MKQILKEQLKRSREMMGLLNEQGKDIISRGFSSLQKTEEESLLKQLDYKLRTKLSAPTLINNKFTTVMGTIKKAIADKTITELELMNMLEVALKAGGKDSQQILSFFTVHNPGLFDAIKSLAGVKGVTKEGIISKFPEFGNIPKDLQDIFLKQSGFDFEKVIPSVVHSVYSKTIKDIEKGKYTIGDASVLSVDELASTKSVMELGDLANKLKQNKILRELEVKSKTRQGNSESMMADAEFDRYVMETQNQNARDLQQLAKGDQKLYQQKRMDNLAFDNAVQDLKAKTSDVTLKVTDNAPKILKNRLKLIGLWSLIAIGVVGASAVVYYLTKKSGGKKPVKRKNIDDY
jgi:hypothetical protein